MAERAPTPSTPPASMGKIFGTGLHRTATTSLNRALGDLGLRSKHAPFGLFEDLDHEVGGQYDAFTDLPVPLLYRALDEKFPGSLFIHTERDVDDWLASVEWLFTEGRLHFHWKAQPVVAEIHEALYGTTTFDAPVFRERYRRHNRAVRRYFADRPDRLLVMDITAGDGWDALCPFLDEEIPEQAFPSTNAAAPLHPHSLRNRLRAFFRFW